MAVSLLVLLGVVALVVLFIVGVRGESKNGGEDMIKKVYVYLVLFATLMMTIGGGVAAFMAAADIVAPTAYHQTFEDYKLYSTERMVKEGGVTTEVSKLTEEQLKANYDAMVVAEKQRQIDRAKNSLIKSLGWIIIPFPVFLYFQRKLKAGGFEGV
ncbi:MAG TPA: hypothetical protein PLC88_00420 [Syntrophomonas sp.]|jgi:hypothetical protein|nr:hypothetical protein [Syntrophomonas sp.]HRW11870.1 hypothetical protein [Syntrophomonas sp.]